MAKEDYVGIANIYSSYNNTIIHVTDITGSETLSMVSGGQITKQQRLEAHANTAVVAAKRIAESIKEKGMRQSHVRVRAQGGHNGSRYPGPGAQPTIRTLTKNGIKILSIEDVTPIPHGGCRKKGGRRGRRVWSLLN